MKHKSSVKTSLLLRNPKSEQGHDATPSDGVVAMGLLLGGLLVFSVWLLEPLVELLRQAATVVEGKR
jgi:hypothetical protein